MLNEREVKLLISAPTYRHAEELAEEKDMPLQPLLETLLCWAIHRLRIEIDRDKRLAEHRGWHPDREMADPLGESK